MFICRIFTFILVLVSIECFQKESKLSSKSEQKPVGKTTNNKCIFDDFIFEIGSKWKPDLGPPFGLLPCYQCSCVASKSPLRSSPTVKCQNILSRCPEVDCENPVIKNGHCCKSCDKNYHEQNDNGTAIKKLIDNKIGLIGGGGDETRLTQNDKESTSSDDECRVNNKTYKNGEQFQSPENKCNKCHCDSGAIKCSSVVCPVLTCSNVTKKTGECCHSCLKETETMNDGMSSSCFFEADETFHEAGTHWHPYLPPFGFDRCSICTCLPEVLKIKCWRQVKCAPLECPRSVSIKLNETDCCRVCPQIRNDDARADNNNNENNSIDIEPFSAARGDCFFRGNWYRNGSRWSPNVASFGPMACVKCTCKNTKAKCSRVKTCLY